MGSLLPLESGCSSFIVQPSDKRPKQTGALARLPDELIVLIGKSIDKPAARDLRSLALSSAGLFKALRPLYYQADNCADFRKALKIPDVARMERNHEFGNFDVSMVWGKKRVKCRCRNTLVKHRTHRPIDVLLFGLIKGIWKTTYPHALMWLYWKGYPVNNWPRDHSSLSTMTNMMPEVLVQLLQRGTNENKVDGICGMIRFLSSQGISIPIRMNPDRAPAYAAKQREQDELNPEFVLGDLNMYFSWHETTIAIALRSHCPPIVLEVLLQEYTKRGVFMTDLELDIWTPPPALKDWYDAQEPFYLDEPDDEPWFIETDFAGVLSGLYADLMEPSSGWREDHQGQTVDIWEAKMSLLVRYGAIDKHERTLFQGTLEALQRIARMVMPSPRTMDADGKERFIALCEGIRHLATTPELMSTYSYDDWSESEFPEKKRRPHRFVLDKDWNPWRDWYLRVKKMKGWRVYGGCYFKYEESLGYNAQWLDLVDFSESDDLPRWYGDHHEHWVAPVGYDARYERWVAALEARDWM